ARGVDAPVRQRHRRHHDCARGGPELDRRLEERRLRRGASTARPEIRRRQSEDRRLRDARPRHRSPRLRRLRRRREGCGHQRNADAVPEEGDRKALPAGRARGARVGIRGRHPRPSHARARRADAVLQAREVAPACRRDVARAARRGTGKRAGPHACQGETMASYPAGLKYTKDHEWIDLSGDRGKVGITDYAQQQLGDVVYVELPDVGARLKQGQSFGTIESVKAVSELYSPVTGEVVEVNAALKDKPEAVNADPHASWMIVVKLTNPGEAAALLDAAQ